MNSWRIKGRELVMGDIPLIMGILNVTPDSFYDGGKYSSMDLALKRVEQMISEGASIIDIGGESTRPDSVPVDEAEEINRISDIVSRISKNFDVAISIDTNKSEVARVALKNGAHIVNDINGLREDANMANIIVEYGAGAVLMANYLNKSTGENVLEYERSCFDSSLNIALKAGISEEQILLDPGIGFNTSREEDKKLLRDLKCYDNILLGISRKRVIDHLLEHEGNPDTRLYGSIGASVAACSMGVRVLRVHDVRETYEALKAYIAIMN